MNNLQWLYDTNDMFRDAVKQAAAYYIGSTSLNFAGTWLEERHRSDYEDLTGQHVDAGVDSREKIDAELVDRFSNVGFCLTLHEVRKLLDRQAAITEHYVLSHPDERDEQIAELQSIAEKYRADAIAAQKERDAYRELCGRMRKMAQEMANMEVD